MVIAMADHGSDSDADVDADSSPLRYSILASPSISLIR